ncbi:MAG: glycerophosphodiester phosphodiesterase family protein [Pedobacter sp.]|nr:MAG: glycerophosphodiester phosphodiesterase family protein [Pedobacter sp.]
MRSIRLLPFFFLLIFQSAAAQKKNHISFATTTEFREYLDSKRDQTKYPLLSAHRGGPMPGFPENCIETFENATKYQPVIIEFDVALSKDSVLVIMHDDKLDRTTNGTGPIGEKTYKELRELLLEDTEGKLTNFKIPTLDEVLLWAKGKVLLTIDVKRGVPFSKVIDAVRRTKAGDYSIVITYNANQAAEVYKLAPDIMLSVSANKKEDIERLNSMGVPNDRMVAFVGTTPPAAENYSYLHGLGIKCILGTMGNIDRSAAASPDGSTYADLINGGADILSTDNLALAGKQLDKLRKQLKLKNKNIRQVEH